MNTNRARGYVGDDSQRPEHNRHRRAQASDAIKPYRVRNERGTGKSEGPGGIVLNAFEAGRR